MPGTRVLVAEDESSIRTLVSKFLQKKGYDVVTASDGADAVTKLDAERFDVVLLDIMMPRIDGFGVMAHLRETQPALAARVVVMTAFPRTAMGRLGDSCRILSKPFDLEELTSALIACGSA